MNLFNRGELLKNEKGILYSHFVLPLFLWFFATQYTKCPFKRYNTIVSLHSPILPVFVSHSSITSFPCLVYPVLCVLLCFCHLFLSDASSTVFFFACIIIILHLLFVLMLSLGCFLFVCSPSLSFSFPLFPDEPFPRLQLRNTALFHFMSIVALFPFIYSFLLFPFVHKVLLLLLLWHFFPLSSFPDWQLFSWKETCFSESRSCTTKFDDTSRIKSFQVNVTLSRHQHHSVVILVMTLLLSSLSNTIQRDSFSNISHSQKHTFLSNKLSIFKLKASIITKFTDENHKKLHKHGKQQWKNTSESRICFWSSFLNDEVLNVISNKPLIFSPKLW